MSNSSPQRLKLTEQSSEEQAEEHHITPRIDILKHRPHTVKKGKLLFHNTLKKPSISTADLARDTRRSEKRISPRTALVHIPRGYGSAPLRRRRRPLPAKQVGGHPSLPWLPCRAAVPEGISLRLRINELCDEMSIPIRDRAMMVKAPVGGGDEERRLSSHLQVLLAHRNRTLQALIAIDKREAILHDIKKCVEPSSPPREEALLRLIAALVACTIQITVRIRRWRELLNNDRLAFPYKTHKNYLRKAFIDFEEVVDEDNRATTIPPSSLLSEVIAAIRNAECFALLLPTRAALRKQDTKEPRADLLFDDVARKARIYMKEEEDMDHNKRLSTFAAVLKDAVPTDLRLSEFHGENNPYLHPDKIYAIITRTDAPTAVSSPRLLGTRDIEIDRPNIAPSLSTLWTEKDGEELHSKTSITSSTESSPDHVRGEGFVANLELSARSSSSREESGNSEEPPYYLDGDIGAARSSDGGESRSSPNGNHESDITVEWQGTMHSEKQSMFVEDVASAHDRTTQKLLLLQVEHSLVLQAMESQRIAEVGAVRKEEATKRSKEREVYQMEAEDIRGHMDCSMEKLVYFHKKQILEMHAEVESISGKRESEIEAAVAAALLPKFTGEKPLNLSPAEFDKAMLIFERGRVSGLNQHAFSRAVLELLPKSEVPRMKDLAKAFALADSSKDEVVDVDEFIDLFSRIKLGELDGVAGYSIFERRQKNKQKQK